MTEGDGGPRLGLVSLGCDKNTVDSERMLAALVAHGARPVRELERAEVVLVNTCGFIDAAKEESVETLLEAARLKEIGRCRTLVAVGCMVERHREAMRRALPEVDLFLGLADLDRLVPELQARGHLAGEPRRHVGERLPLGTVRHVAYLKVSEGCDHGCAFCAIPLWRGRHRSFEADRLVAEARRLEAQGAVEVNLVAQDLAHYGRDFRDGTSIATLLERLVAETDVPWFRMLYIYSAGLREPLVELMAREPRVLPYVDMPIQHASDPVLERMRRPERRDTLWRKIAWLREAVPDVTLRTTVMVGFPGETDEDFRALLDFMEEARFDRLGAFAFSPQEGTRAAEMNASLAVPPPVARERLEELLEVQRAISAERAAAEVGRRREALVDEALQSRHGPPEASAGGNGRGGGAEARGAGPAEAYRAVGRLASQADDVDGITSLASPFPLAGGQLVEVEVTGAGDFDLEARALREVRPAPRHGTAELARAGGSELGDGVEPRRPLPVAPLGLETARGR